MIKMMSIHRSVAAVLGIVTALLVANKAHSQDVIIDRGTSGVRESARFADRTPIDYDTVAATRNLRALNAVSSPPPPRYNLLFTPSGVAVEGASVYGATVGFINRSLLTSLPFQLRAGYRRVDIADGDSQDRINVNGKVKLNFITKFDSAATVSLIGDITRTVDLSTKYEATLAAERALTPKLYLGVNGSYIEKNPEAGPSTDAFVVSGGGGYAITDRTEFGVDYRFDNPMDEEDDYSFTVTQLLTNPTLPHRMSLVFGAGKHRTVFATFVVVF